MKTFHVENLTFGYDTTTLFKNWTLSIPTGVVLVRCEESRGKTTLLKLLSGLLTPQAGQLSLDGNTLTDAPELYQRGIFYVEPTSEAFDQISPMHFFARCKEKFEAFDESMLDTLIEGLSLRPHQDKPIYMLSAGSKRKVWIAAALASNARVAIIDDLTAALDKASIAFLTGQLAGLAERSNERTVIVAHYDTLAGVPFSLVIDI